MTEQIIQSSDEPPPVTETKTDHIRQLIEQQRALEQEAHRSRQRFEIIPSRPVGDESQYRNGAEWRAAVIHGAITEAQRATARAAADEAAQRALHARGQTFQARVNNYKAAAPDFDQVARNPDLHITPVMAEAITDSNVGPQVSYWLGQHPSEAARIALLHPVRQVAEIGQLEARLGSAPTSGRTTGAAPSSRPISASTALRSEPDLGDPKMSNEEYRRIRRGK